MLLVTTWLLQHFWVLHVTSRLLPTNIFLICRISCLTIYRFCYPRALAWATVYISHRVPNIKWDQRWVDCTCSLDRNEACILVMELWAAFLAHHPHMTCIVFWCRMRCVGAHRGVSMGKERLLQLISPPPFPVSTRSLFPCGFISSIGINLLRKVFSNYCLRSLKCTLSSYCFLCFLSTERDIARFFLFY